MCRLSLSLGGMGQRHTQKGVKSQHVSTQIPNKPPTVKLILESNSPSGIRKTIQEIKKDKKEPRNNFKNNHPPDLEITILKFAIG
jgi:hypothetical protein